MADFEITVWDRIMASMGAKWSFGGGSGVTSALGPDCVKI